MNFSSVIVVVLDHQEVCRPTPHQYQQSRKMMNLEWTLETFEIKTHHLIFHLQLSLSKHYQPCTVVLSQSELVEEKDSLKGQSEHIEGKPHSHHYDTQFTCAVPMEKYSKAVVVSVFRTCPWTPSGSSQLPGQPAGHQLWPGARVSWCWASSYSAMDSCLWTWDSHHLL